MGTCLKRKTPFITVGYTVLQTYKGMLTYSKTVTEGRKRSRYLVEDLFSVSFKLLSCSFKIRNKCSQFFLCVCTK